MPIDPSDEEEKYFHAVDVEARRKLRESLEDNARKLEDAAKVAAALATDAADAPTPTSAWAVGLATYDAASGKVTATKNGATIAESQLKTLVILDEVRAGGRIPLIIGRGLTSKAREALGLPVSTLFRLPQQPNDPGTGYSLAQKMVGRACGLPEGKGILPGTYCEPKMTTVGSQDTTGPMTRDELKDLACLGFSADLVMQSFCHTAAYPKKVDIETHHTLPQFIEARGGIALRPGDGGGVSPPGH